MNALEDHPIMTNQFLVFIGGISSAFISWVSFHGLKFQMAVIDLTSANNFIEITQPIISYLGTFIGLLASFVALIVGCINLKAKLVRLFRKKRRHDDQ